MAFVKGQSGNPSGRPKGLKDKRSIAADVKAIAEAHDFDPFIEMIKLAKNPTVDESVRFQCCKELAQYLAPKLKAITIDAGEETQEAIKHVFNI